MLTLKEGEERRKSDRQAERPISDFDRGVGGEWAGSDLPAEQATGWMAVGRREGAEREGWRREGGLLQPNTLPSKLTILLSASVEEGDACCLRHQHAAVCSLLRLRSIQKERQRVIERQKDKEKTPEETKTGRERE